MSLPWSRSGKLRNAVAKLKRAADERPCPKCGKRAADRNAPNRSPNPPRTWQDVLDGLTPEQQQELAEIILPRVHRCHQCGVTDIAFNDIPDEHKRRLLVLLRATLGTDPKGTTWPPRN